MVALQLALVCFTAVALLGLLPLLYFLGHWYLVQRSPLEAWESPQRSLSRRWSSFGRASPAHPVCRTPDVQGQREHGRVWSDPVNVKEEAATPMDDGALEEDTQCQGADLARQALADGQRPKGWREACQVASHQTALLNPAQSNCLDTPGNAALAHFPSLVELQLILRAAFWCCLL